ncbi:MAG TPA: putative quinol monooxygenase [Solirubrobacterales bacterium]|nr:putative quinol monooxygenase [Solirubrobacterales bacterium]
MIVVTASLRCPEERREAFLRAARELSDASRREPGCREHRLLADAVDGESFVWLERWSDEGALATHRDCPHVAAYRRAVAGLVVRGSTQVYEANPLG